MIKTFSNNIPVYLQANYGCYEPLNEVYFRILIKEIDKNNHLFIMSDTQDYLITNNNRNYWIDKKISTIYYHPSYKINNKKLLGFKINGVEKGVLFIFNNKNKTLLTKSGNKHFNFNYNDHLIEGTIENKKNKILIYLKCVYGT
jgi:hypothetical protein